MNELSLLLNLLYIKFIQDFQGILLVLHRIQNHSKLSVVCPRFKPVTGPASKWLKHVVQRTRLSDSISGSGSAHSWVSCWCLVRQRVPTIICQLQYVWRFIQTFSNNTTDYLKHAERDCTRLGCAEQKSVEYIYACADLPQLIVPTLAEQLEMRT